MKRFSIILTVTVIGTILFSIMVISFVKNDKCEKIPYDHVNSKKLDQLFIDASKVFEINETKEIVFDNPCDADCCVLALGGSSFVSPEEVYEEYLKKQIPDSVIKQLMQQNYGEGANLYFLKDDTIISSIKLFGTSSKDEIYYTKIGKKITFSIQLDHRFTEQMINDPNYFKHPERGQDYLTNPKHRELIEIVEIK